MTAVPLLSGSAALLGGVGADVALHVPGWELACLSGLAVGCTAAVVALWPWKRGAVRPERLRRPALIVGSTTTRRIAPALAPSAMPVPRDMAAIVLESWR